MNTGGRGDIDSLRKHLGLDKRDTSYILIPLFPRPCGPMAEGCLA